MRPMDELIWSLQSAPAGASCAVVVWGLLSASKGYHQFLASIATKRKRKAPLQRAPARFCGSLCAGQSIPTVHFIPPRCRMDRYTKHTPNAQSDVRRIIARDFDVTIERLSNPSCQTLP